MTRKLAHIERIVEIIPIEGADRIVQYRVLGWRVIDQKGKYNVGDLVVYAECDAWMPHTLAPFLTKPGHFPKTYNGIEGQRLKTIKLKGALSQGLLLPISQYNVCGDDISSFKRPDGVYVLFPFDDEGTDVDKDLGIVKWEPEPEKIPTNAKGNFPSFIPKTDQERIQNCSRTVEQVVQNNPDAMWVAEEKAEGSSVTVFLNGDEFGICSCRLQLKIDDPEVFQASHFTKPAYVADLEAKLRELGRNLAVQSEVVGPGIQGGYYDLTDWEYRVFDIFDIDAQKYLPPLEVYSLAGLLGLKTVPVVHMNVKLPSTNVDELLAHAEGDSQIGNVKNLLREGIVWKRMDGERFTFKAVSNEYLLKRGY